MLKLAPKTKILLVVAMSALANASPVPAQTGAKPSKPLNLLAFARASRVSAVQKQPPPATSTDNACRGLKYHPLINIAGERHA